MSLQGPLRIGVHGASGRMGKLVWAMVEDAPDLEVAWICGREGMPQFGGAGSGADAGADVIVDFSSPEGLRALLLRARGPVVSGTTGIAPEDLAAMVRAGEEARGGAIPFLHAANFSLGVAVLARLVEQAARMLEGFDAEIIEIHHSAKRDAPSGTALRLADAIDAGRGARAERSNGRDGLRAPGSVGLHAVRAGDVIGEHTVMLAGVGERLELRHIASRREVFAAGAVAAARWLAAQPPGRYGIGDVLDRRG